jgi:glyoxylase-like metal-dependent hydrolase (beta-lactamase superfamily II)
VNQLLAGALLCLHAACAWALEVRFEPVAANVYVYVGDTGGRTVGNQALNANLGLVVTPAGAVLIDSGPTWQTAQQIHAAVRRVTAQPLRWVINTGGQDHRWLGNGYFLSQGAELIAHAHALPDMRARGADQVAALRSLLSEAAAGTEPVLPARLIDSADARLELGGTVFELRHRGGGHTPGDLMVWLPQSKVLFTGDIVYVDRMLAVIPVSSTRHWLQAFEVVEALAPTHIVPGHGRVTDLATARTQTRDYLVALRGQMKRAVDEGTDPSTAARGFDSTRWQHLRNADELLLGNASRVYLEVERE